MIVALFAVPTVVLALAAAYVWGRTHAIPTRMLVRQLDAWDELRECPKCGRLMFPSGEGGKAICWPCLRARWNSEWEAKL